MKLPSDIRSLIERFPVCVCGSLNRWRTIRILLQHTQETRQMALIIGGRIVPHEVLELIYYAWDRAGFMEHGTGILSGWLTPDGERLLEWLQENPELDPLDMLEAEKTAEAEERKKAKALRKTARAIAKLPPKGS